MIAPSLDLEKVRAAIRRMDRDSLLVFVYRAVELLSPVQLTIVFQDYIRLQDLAPSGAPPPSLLDEVRRFHADSLAGKYYEGFDVTSKNCTSNSYGTQSFIAEFDRLVNACVRAATTGPYPPLREAFELLFAILRRIDEGMDDVLFFADEGGSRAVGMVPEQVLPAYFHCLAAATTSAEYDREVNRAIQDLAGFSHASLRKEADDIGNRGYHKRG